MPAEVLLHVIIYELQKITITCYVQVQILMQVVGMFHLHGKCDNRKHVMLMCMGKYIIGKMLGKCTNKFKINGCIGIYVQNIS